jgi:hypothetical protein
MCTDWNRRCERIAVCCSVMSADIHGISVSSYAKSSELEKVKSRIVSDDSDCKVRASKLAFPRFK